jgi:hypothetical protein
MKNQPIQIPDDIAARCTGLDQSDRFKTTLKAMLSDGSNTPAQPVAPKPRGRPRKAPVKADNVA